ncbi:MAG TPA: chromosomal replication initiator protein DnaA [Patescibacteria group bacterium]|nr:chromosomal replication initiator protein DnaA [Patescibacteria group bacterium]
MDSRQVWSSVLSELELSLSPGNFSTWVSPLRVVNLTSGQEKELLTIGCPSVFHKNYVADRFLGQIQQVAQKTLNKACEIELTIVQTKKEPAATADDLFSTDPSQLMAEAYSDAIAKAGLNLNLTFKNFAVSTSNEVAHAAARTAAKNPGQTYQLVFIYGGVGVGKTHLMQAVGHEILAHFPDSNLVYCTGEEFTNEIIEAIRNKTTPVFRQKYRKTRTLLLDDVQFIGGKNTVQEEFFHTFNAVIKEGGQVVLTSDRLPSEIEGLEDRLRSRFEGGLTVDIQQPGFELRTAILLIKAAQRRIELPMRVAQVIAANVESTRKLEGVLLRLSGELLTRKEPLTEELALALLNKINGEVTSPKQQLTVQKVLSRVAEHFQVKVIDLKGDRRLRSVALPRQISMYLLRKELSLPLEEVGRVLGGRDHTTIMHGEDKITKALAVSENLRLDVTTIRQQLYDAGGQNA